MAKYELKRLGWMPGSAVLRFGDWRKKEPTVLLDSRHWVGLGKPDKVTVLIED